MLKREKDITGVEFKSTKTIQGVSLNLDLKKVI